MTEWKIQHAPRYRSRTFAEGKAERIQATKVPPARYGGGGMCRLSYEETQMATYQGKEVKIVRPARQGDQGFKNDQSEQVMIKGEDGQEKCVAKDQVKE